MTINSMALISNLIYTAMSIVIIIRNARLIGKNSRSITAAFFTLSACSMLLSYIYWLAYEILRPGIRMPFAANEVGEMAINLLLASVLVTVFGMNKISSYKEAIFGIAFQIACILLWIGWSGEWVQDILSGLILCYLVFMTVKALIISGAFNRREWQFQGISLGLLAILQGMTFLLEGKTKATLDVICYVVIFIICIFYTLKTIGAARNKASSEVLLSLACVSFIYGLNAMYMSAEPMYYAAELFCNAMYIMISLAIKRVVMEE